MLKMFLENLITKKRDAFEDIMSKLDIFFAGDRITAEDYTELQNLAIDTYKTEEEGM